MSQSAHTLDRLAFGAAVIASHVEAIAARVSYIMRPLPRDFHRGIERRRNPRYCPLCHGPMQKDGQRPPRDSRGNGGQIKRLPGEVLVWFRCGRCHQSLIGVPDHKLAGPGYRRAA